MPDQPDQPDQTGQPAPVDPHRRRFFRAFAGDVASSVGTMLGAAQVLQAESASAARELLGVAAPAPEAPPPGPSAQGPYDASTAGYRAPFRWDEDVCFLMDQRRLPDVLQELEVRGTADAVNAINDGAVPGSAAQAQLAAVTMALVAAKAIDSRPFARRATIRGAANAFRLTRPGSAAMGLALDRILAIQEATGDDAPGAELAAAMHAEAEAMIAEATHDHGRIAVLAPEAVPGATDSPLHVLLFGSTGAMGSGTFGTALGVVTTLHHAQRPVHALVAETRPDLVGARIAAWELGQAGVPYAIVTDAAAPGCIAASEVGVVLVTADRVAANGDVIATAGTYPLALAAAAAGIPFVVCVSTTAFDLSIAVGDDGTIEEGRPDHVLNLHGKRIAPQGTHVRNPVQDLTPAALVAAIVTEEGVLRAPWEPSLARAAASAGARRSAAPGFAALLAQRAAAVEAARDAEAEREARPGTDADTEASAHDPAEP